MANIDLINRLVEESFGKGFVGNYSLTNDFDGSLFIERSSGAKQISKRCWFPIPFIFEFWNHAGRFTKEDGSELEIYHPQYIQAAEKYSQLYEKETGKEVTIRAGFSPAGIADAIATPH